MAAFVVQRPPALAFEAAPAIDRGEVTVDLAAYESVQRRAGQDPGLALAITVPGGGHRSANYMVGAFLALEQMAGSAKAQNLLMEFDYFSTASSGGSTTGAMLASLNDHIAASGSAEGYSFRNALDGDDGNGDSSLSAALSANLHKVIILQGGLRDVIPGRHRRSDHFERFLDERLLRGLTFGDIFEPRGGEAPRLPYWFPISSIAGNSGIFPHCPDVYASYQLTEYRHMRHDKRFGGDYYSTPCSVALRASMSFPVLVQPSSFKSSRHPDRPYLRLKDGGLADNIGYVTALRVLRQDPAPRRVLVVFDANRTWVEPWEKQGGRERLLRQTIRAAAVPIDSRSRLYREELATRDVRRGPEGRIRSGRTHDGIDVVFLYPELLDYELAAQLKAIGTTLKVSAAEHRTLVRAGWEVVRAQQDALRSCIIPGAGPGPPLGEFEAERLPAAAALPPTQPNPERRGGPLRGRLFRR